MSDPPEPLDDEAPARGKAPAVKPMSPLAALLWTFGATFGFVWLYSITVAIREEAADDSVNKFACQLVAYLAALFAILRLHAPDASIRAFVGLRRTHPAFYPIAAALGLALTAPTNWIYAAIEARYPDPVSDDHLLDSFIAAPVPMRVAIGFIFIVLGPALEEVFFRGAIFQPLRRKVGPVAVVAFTSVLFAVAHIDWRLFVPIAIVGAALGYLRVASGSIVPSAILHACFNAVPFYSLVVAARGGPALEESVPVAIGVGSAAVAFGLVAAAYGVGRSSRTATLAREGDLA